ncbi:mitochondria-eating protein [Chamaea fasciata]|uniref:mitochondria-eating protein n=1 Tax=Chamaea fasciata TaxID=190680 RepID=UPI00336A409C
MARVLKSLVGAGSARELQEKLESWNQEYELNTNGENLSRCCELLELNTAIQKQLFSILNETSQQDECPAAKSCLLAKICYSSGGQNRAGGELQLRDLASKPKCRLRDLEEKLAETRVELCEMEKDLKRSCAQDCKTLRKLKKLNDNEQKLQLLQDEISILDCQRSALQCRLARSCSPRPCRASKCCVSCDPCDLCIPCDPCDPCSPCNPCIPCDPCGPCSPCKPCIPCDPCNPCKPCDPYDPCKPCSPCRLPVKICSPAQCRRTNASRRACLIARFNFIYAKDRLDAEILLKKLICDIEMVQRAIYIAVLESFRAAKKTFWKVKKCVKETLAINHCGGPASLEIAALDYIVCHKDVYDVCCSVQEVICCMHVNPKLPCPENVDFSVISCFIRVMCCLAFSMQTLSPPLDVAFGVDGELFSRRMYYRSCDSDFTAPFVAYHVWPALMENNTVLVKGEVVTRKMVQCYCRSKLRSGSCSCGRRLLPGPVTRSRSLSTVPFKTSCKSVSWFLGTHGIDIKPLNN